MDNQVFMVCTSSSEALLNVFCSFYVFSIAYSKEVLKSLLFSQQEVMGLNDDSSTNCPGLSLLVKSMNIAESSE